MNKPRYWNTAYPLVITSLCVAPHDFFLRHWMTCVEVSFSKLKVRVQYKIILFVSINNIILGEALSGPCVEWTSSSCLDIFISVPRVAIHCYSED